MKIEFTLQSTLRRIMSAHPHRLWCSDPSDRAQSLIKASTLAFPHQTTPDHPTCDTTWYNCLAFVTKRTTQDKSVYDIVISTLKNLLFNAHKLSTTTIKDGDILKDIPVAKTNTERSVDSYISRHNERENKCYS